MVPQQANSLDRWVARYSCMQISFGGEGDMGESTGLFFILSVSNLRDHFCHVAIDLRHNTQKAFEWEEEGNCEFPDSLLLHSLACRRE